MQIRVLDFRGFDERLDVPAPCSVGQLRELIAAHFGYSMQTSALCHGGAVLDPRQTLAPADVAADGTFVLFNERLFPVKSFPTVDHAFRFFPTRYQEFYCGFARADGAPVRGIGLRAADLRARIASGAAPQRRFASFAQARRPDFPAIRDPGAPEPSPFGHDYARFLGRVARAARGAAGPLRMELPALARGAERARDIPDHMIPPGVDLSQEDRAAVVRLVGSTGVDLNTVIQVFCACDRSEAAAEGCLIAMG
jgi:hypothetical protein